MAAPIWPLNLPQRPQDENYGDETPSMLVSNSMDAGTKTRFEGVIKPTVYPCTYVLSLEEYTTLKQFFYKTLSKGTKAFDWPNPETGEYMRVKFTADQSISRKRWKSTYEYSVTLNLEYIDYGNFT